MFFKQEPILPTYGKTAEVFIEEAKESGDDRTAEALRKLQQLRESMVEKRKAERE